MADRTVYVASSGGDYTSLNAALSGEITAEGGSIDTTTDNGSGSAGKLTFSCANFEDTTEVAWPVGYTSNVTYPIEIVSENSHGGEWSTSAYRINVQGTIDDGCFRMNTSANTNYLVFRGIQFREYGTTNYTYGIRLQSAASGTVVVMDKCIILGDHGDADANVYGINHSDTDIRLILVNTLIYGWERGISISSSTTGSHVLYNVTLDDCVTGIYYTSTNSAQAYIKNTRITGCTSAYTEGSTGYLLNASSDNNLSDADMSSVTNWGANSIDSSDTPTIDYVDDSNATKTSRDYHLGATDSGIGAGVDLSTDPSGQWSFSDDIDGETRG